MAFRFFSVEMLWLVCASALAIAVLSTWMSWRYRRAYLKVSELLHRNKELVANLHEGIYHTTLDGRHLSANPAVVRLNGYSSEAELLASVKDLETEWYVEPNRRRQFWELLERAGKVENFISEIYRLKTRERIWVSESARLVRDSRTGKALYCEGSIREITETIRRLQLEERFSKLTRLTPVGLFQMQIIEGATKLLYANEGWERITGVTREEIGGSALLPQQQIHHDDLERLVGSLADSVRRIVNWTEEFRYTTPAGEELWLKISAEPEVTDGAVVYHGYLMDVSERRRHLLEIEKLAYFDNLTGLPNRRLLLERMAGAIAERRSIGDLGAVLFIDLDNFKSLNDTQGHDIGDAFLQEIANRLKKVIRPQDTVARMGGDEFVAILNGIGSDQASAREVGLSAAENALAAIRAGVDIGGLHLFASASIGVAIFDGTELNPGELLKHADIAMYRAKTSGRNAIGILEPSDVEDQAARYRLAGELGEALAEDQLELFIQPQIDAGGRIQAAEALVRWRHPKRGLIYPDEFLGIADQFGLTAEMEKTILAKGIGILRDWSRDPRTSRLQLSLNVGAQAISNDGFVQSLQAMILEHGVDTSLLKLEITEHVMAKDHERISKSMAQLKRMGVGLSLDDFGTGYSSLAYLKQLPFDEIKIDGRFVKDIERGESDRALVQAIVSMAQSLGMLIVAEHVENAAQEDFLRSLGCNRFQGYLYSAAVSPVHFLQLLGVRKDERHGYIGVADPYPTAPSSPDEDRYVAAV